jgi:hypothetical protein
VKFKLKNGTACQNNGRDPEFEDLSTVQLFQNSFHSSETQCTTSTVLSYSKNLYCVRTFVLVLYSYDTILFARNNGIIVSLNFVRTYCTCTLLKGAWPLRL